jgi:hypothetical protein
MKRLWIKFIASLPLADTVILVDNGKTVIKRGKIKSALKSQLDELAKSLRINTACINASENSRGFMITFFGISEEFHQRFRNVWGVNR